MKKTQLSKDKVHQKVIAEGLEKAHQKPLAENRR